MLDTEKIKKKISLAERKKNILFTSEEFKTLRDEFQAYEFKLYKFQDKLLETKGGKLLEKQELLGDFLTDEEDKRKLLEIFREDIVFK